MKFVVVVLLAALVAVSQAKSVSTTESALKKCVGEWTFNFIRSECADLELSACVAKAKEQFTSSTCQASSSVSSHHLGKTSSHALVGDMASFSLCIFSNVFNILSGSSSTSCL